MRPAGIAGLDQLGEFHEVIDVRSPAEYADDHVPGAINCPVLDNNQRAEVGRLYEQVSPFEAKKIGAALVAENVARHLRERFLDRPKDWQPLIYCWRGGNRSGAMTTIFRAIGWKACQLEGGYKNYRRSVLDALERLPQQFRFRVVCGPTGSAKTRVLHALAEGGEQVLDLESLACHKGSVLGVLPDTPQPSQKALESALLVRLRAFDPSRPVYVEAESPKIGRLRLPEALVVAMRAGECITVETDLVPRVHYLLEDYDYFLTDPERLKWHLQGLAGLHSRETIGRWIALADEGCWAELVASLLETHYDPHYRRSQERHFPGATAPKVFRAESLGPADIRSLADRIVGSDSPGGPA